MLDGLMDWLGGLAADPWAYLLFFFIFVFLAAVILPIPVELGLIGLIAQDFQLFGLDIFPSFLLLAVIMGVGKAAGSWVVFYIGLKVEDAVMRWFRWNWFKKLTELSQRFCVKTGYLGVYLILSIPMMPDTVPLYIFAILNDEGEIFEASWFVMANFWSGISRALIIGIAAMGVVIGVWG